MCLCHHFPGQSQIKFKGLFSRLCIKNLVSGENFKSKRNKIPRSDRSHCFVTPFKCSYLWLSFRVSHTELKWLYKLNEVFIVSKSTSLNSIVKHDKIEKGDYLTTGNVTLHILQMFSKSRQLSIVFFFLFLTPSRDCLSITCIQTLLQVHSNISCIYFPFLVRFLLQRCMYQKVRKGNTVNTKILSVKNNC